MSRPSIQPGTRTLGEAADPLPEVILLQPERRESISGAAVSDGLGGDVGASHWSGKMGLTTDGASIDVRSRSSWAIPAEGLTTLVMLALAVLSIAWILIEVAPRFRSAPVSLPPQQTLWSSYTRPRASSIEPGPPIEVGVSFRPTVPGFITALRFYKAKGSSGPHVGSLWGANGDRLATVTFANETETGWQEAAFATPVEVAANKLLVASYFSPSGSPIFLGKSLLGGPEPLPSGTRVLHLAAYSPANVYRQEESGFPATNAGNRSFWVDIVFVPEAALE